MKHLLSSCLLAFALAAPAAAATYEIDARHTQVFFTYGHGGYSNLKGRLNEVSGRFDTWPARISSTSRNSRPPASRAPPSPCAGRTGSRWRGT